MIPKPKTRDERVAEKVRASIDNMLGDEGRFAGVLPDLKKHMDVLSAAVATGHPDDLARLLGPGVEYDFQGLVQRLTNFKLMLRGDWSNANLAVEAEDAAVEAARIEAEAAKEREREAREQRRADYERLKALEAEFGE